MEAVNRSCQDRIIVRTVIVQREAAINDVASQGSGALIRSEIDHCRYLMIVEQFQVTRRYRVTDEEQLGVYVANQWRDVTASGHRAERRR